MRLLSDAPLSNSTTRLFQFRLKLHNPDGAEVSAFEHLLAGQKTISPNAGLFLKKTWRLHPKLCNFTSEVFYEGRQDPREGLENQRIEGHSWLGQSGLWFVPVHHEGNQNASSEEGECIAGLVSNLVQIGASWIDEKGRSRPMQEEALCRNPRYEQEGTGP
jgi:superfamily I DNA and/or RNA helicase